MAVIEIKLAPARQLAGFAEEQWSARNTRHRWSGHSNYSTGKRKKECY
jgi:hypothetical protein